MTEEMTTFDSEDDFMNPNKRPQFLKVLCILSWIYVGFGVISSLSSAFSSETEQIQSLEEVKSIYENMEMPLIKDDMISFISTKQDNYKLENTGNFILILIEGLAVYLMFMQKRTGFWIYSGVQVAFILLYISIYPFPNIFSVFALVFLCLGILIFEILYALNLKHMNN